MNNKGNYHQGQKESQPKQGQRTQNSEASPNYPKRFNPAGSRARCSYNNANYARTPVNSTNKSQAVHRPVEKVYEKHNQRNSAGSWVIRIICTIMVFTLSAFFLSSGDKMNLTPVTMSANDRDTVFASSSANLLSASLSEIYNMPKLYVLEQNNEPTPVPNSDNFIKIDDPERKNYDGSPIDYYSDETIEVKCWKEKIDGTIYDFAEVEIAHPSQFRRKLVDDVISKKHLDYPLNTFRKMNGVVGMSADYCAFRSFGIIVQYGSMVRDTVMGDFDILIYDKEGNFNCITDTKYKKSEYYQSNDVVYTFAFGPVMVDNYEINPSDNLDSYIVGEVGKVYPRAAIGQFGYDKHYLLCTVEYTNKEAQGATVRRFAEVMQSKGLRIAYNMDGGQTAALMYNNELFNKVAYGGQREISDILFFATAIPNK